MIALSSLTEVISSILYRHTYQQLCIKCHIFFVRIVPLYNLNYVLAEVLQYDLSELYRLVVDQSE